MERNGNTIPAPLTKRALAIDVMKANQDKQMDVVVDLIARANQITHNAARSYYKWIVNNGLAPGVIVERAEEETEVADPQKKIYRPRSVRNPQLAAAIGEKSNLRRKNKQRAA